MESCRFFMTWPRMICPPGQAAVAGSARLMAVDSRRREKEPRKTLASIPIQQPQARPMTSAACRPTPPYENTMMMHGACACTSGYAHTCALFPAAPRYGLPSAPLKGQKRRRWKTRCSVEDGWVSKHGLSAARTRGGESATDCTAVSGAGGREDPKLARTGRGRVQTNREVR
jgi:hypothetical protein